MKSTKTFDELIDLAKRQKQNRLKKILVEEEEYLEYLYYISKYKEHPHRFCVVVTYYNDPENRLYLRNLDSIFMQNYENYHVVYTDDASPKNTSKLVEDYLKARP